MAAERKGCLPPGQPETEKLMAKPKGDHGQAQGRPEIECKVALVAYLFQLVQMAAWACCVMFVGPSVWEASGMVLLKSGSDAWRLKLVLTMWRWWTIQRMLA
jgi:hypothetical protein